MKEKTSRLDVLLPNVVKELIACEGCPANVKRDRQGLSVAGQHAVIEVLHQLITILFPGCHRRQEFSSEHDISTFLRESLRKTASTLQEQVRLAYEFQCKKDDCHEDCDACAEKADRVVTTLIEDLPSLLKVLQKDVQAAYEGDPAARSTMEVVMSYPGVFAVTVHRLAHRLQQEAVPLIPRIMSEHAHSRTGIDIHPGATIGEGFFIDHGTGVVIGETCVIGRNVKIYQGVTLGAFSFVKDDQGRLVKGVKRHPDVEDDVVIYAGATILGGSTVIGQGSVIGANVWLTHSVPPRSKVYNQQPQPLIREADGRWATPEGPWDNLGEGI